MKLVFGHASRRCLGVVALFVETTAFKTVRGFGSETPTYGVPTPGPPETRRSRMARLVISTTAVPISAASSPRFGSSKDLDGHARRRATSTGQWAMVVHRRRSSRVSTRARTRRSQDGDMTSRLVHGRRERLANGSGRTTHSRSEPSADVVAGRSDDDHTTLRKRTATKFGSSFRRAVSPTCCLSDQRARQGHDIERPHDGVQHEDACDWRAAYPRRPHPIIGGGEPNAARHLRRGEGSFRSSVRRASRTRSSMARPALTSRPTRHRATSASAQTYRRLTTWTRRASWAIRRAVFVTCSIINRRTSTRSTSTRFAMRSVAVLPEPPVGGEASVHLVWDPDLESVIVRWYKDLFVVETRYGQDHALFPRPMATRNGANVWVPSSTLFFRRRDTKDRRHRRHRLGHLGCTRPTTG